MREEIKQQIELLDLCLEEYSFPDKEPEAAELTMAATTMKSGLDHDSEDYNALNRAMVRLGRFRQLKKNKERK